MGKKFSQISNSTGNYTTGAFLLGVQTDGSDVLYTPAQAKQGIDPELIADTTFYVRTDGNNANDGKTNTAGGAWATLQYAYDSACDMELNGFTVTIQIADGTYAGVYTTKSSISGKINFSGNQVTPANVIVTHSTVDNLSCFAINGANAIQIAYLTCNGTLSPGSGYGVRATDPLSSIYLLGVSFTGNFFKAVNSYNGANLHLLDSPFTISCSAFAAFAADDAATLKIENASNVTVSGSPVITTFVEVITGSCLIVVGGTFTGSSLGAKFSVTTGGIIQTGTNNLNFFPGSAVGTISGGQYDEYSEIGISFGQSLTLGPVAASTAQGLNILQSGPASGTAAGPVRYNLINITSDDLNITGDGEATALEVAYAFGGSNMVGVRYAAAFNSTFSSASSTANSNTNYLALAGRIDINSSDGGTNLTTGSRGGAFGANLVVASENAVVSNWGNVCGLELDFSLPSMATGGTRLFTAINALKVNSDLRGSSHDAAYCVGGNGNNYWNIGFSVSDQSGSVGVATAGTILGLGAVGNVATPWTFGNGIDFRNATFATAAIALGTAAAINWNNGNTTLGHSSSTLTVNGSGVLNALKVDVSVTTADGGTFYGVYNNASPIMSIGNYSAVVGGTYSSAPTLVHNGNLIFYNGSATSAVLDSSGGFTPVGFIKTPLYAQTGTTTIGALPSATAGIKGARYMVTDSTATAAFNALATATGATTFPVWCDGSAWRIG